MNDLVVAVDGEEQRAGSRAEPGAPLTSSAAEQARARTLHCGYTVHRRETYTVSLRRTGDE